MTGRGKKMLINLAWYIAGLPSCIIPEGTLESHRAMSGDNGSPHGNVPFSLDSLILHVENCIAGKSLWEALFSAW